MWYNKSEKRGMKFLAVCEKPIRALLESGGLPVRPVKPQPPLPEFNVPFPWTSNTSRHHRSPSTSEQYAYVVYSSRVFVTTAKQLTLTAAMPSVSIGFGAGPSYRGGSNGEDERRRRELERQRMLEQEERRRAIEEYERRRALEERERQRVLEEEERQRAYRLEMEERQRRQAAQQSLVHRAALSAVAGSPLAAVAMAEASLARQRDRRRQREREREEEREEHARVQLQDWLRGWSGYDIKPVRQPPPPRYEPPEAISSNLARLVDDLFPPTAPTPVVSSGTGRSHGRRKGKERWPQVFAAPEPTRGVPPGLFDQPDRGFDKLATLAGQLSTLAKKAEGHGQVSPLLTHRARPFTDFGFQLARELRKECGQTQQVNEVLFKDKQLLGGYTAVFDQLSPVGQMVLSAAAENSMDALLGALSGSTPNELESTLETALATVQQANNTVKGHIRHFLLESSAFNRLDVLANISHLQRGAAADLGLVEDARLRAENIMNRVSTGLSPALW